MRFRPPPRKKRGQMINARKYVYWKTGAFKFTPLFKFLELYELNPLEQMVWTKLYERAERTWRAADPIEESWGTGTRELKKMEVKLVLPTFAAELGAELRWLKRALKRLEREGLIRKAIAVTGIGCIFRVARPEELQFMRVLRNRVCPKWITPPGLELPGETKSYGVPNSGEIPECPSETQGLPQVIHNDDAAKNSQNVALFDRNPHEGKPVSALSSALSQPEDCSIFVVPLNRTTLKTVSASFRDRDDECATDGALALKREVNVLKRKGFLRLVALHNIYPATQKVKQSRALPTLSESEENMRLTNIRFFRHFIRDGVAPEFERSVRLPINGRLFPTADDFPSAVDWVQETYRLGRLERRAQARRRSPGTPQTDRRYLQGFTPHAVALAKVELYRNGAPWSGEAIADVETYLCAHMGLVLARIRARIVERERRKRIRIALRKVRQAEQFNAKLLAFRWGRSRLELRRAIDEVRADFPLVFDSIPKGSAGEAAIAAAYAPGRADTGRPGDRRLRLIKNAV